MTDLAVVADRQPWEKMPRESFKAFQAFALYRDLGLDRSIPKAAAALGKNVSLLHGWSAKHHWLERAEAYDLERDRRFREQRESEVDQATRLERTAAQTLQRIALERVRGRGVPGEDGYVAPLNPGELSAQDVVRYLTDGIKLRRLADGQPTDVLKAAMMVAPAEMERIVRGVIEVALPLIPEELHERFILGVQALVAK